MKDLLKVAMKNCFRQDERVVVIESARDIAKVNYWNHEDMIEILVALLNDETKNILFDTANEVYMEVCNRDV